MTAINTMNSFVNIFSAVKIGYFFEEIFPPRTTHVLQGYSAQVTTINTKPRQEMAATVTHTHQPFIIGKRRT